ncbi:MAG: hypothetical protein ACE37F_00010 [Nannocystaceae bacterium]|nr:hypothetical protein [bacterium]
MWDDRLSSTSVLVRMTVDEYLKVARDAYTENGAIEGQRSALKTTSALRIRARMAQDVEDGAILPPVVLGIPGTKDVPRTVLDEDAGATEERIRGLPSRDVAIIDGMQRTTVLLDHREKLQSKDLRVEFWFVPETSALTYRMLVLNTGQVPWNLRRQLEVVYSSLVSEIEAATSEGDGQQKIEIFQPTRQGNAERRRTRPGQYQADTVIELYMAFALRKTKVDKESTLAQQFSRIDMADALSNHSFLPAFIGTLRMMSQLDAAIFPASNRLEAEARGATPQTAGNIFGRLPTCIGFCVACAQIVYGRPGSNVDAQVASARFEGVQEHVTAVVERLLELQGEELDKFVDLATLFEVLGRPSGTIGEFERAVYLEAFKVLMKEGADLESLTPCWRAH